MAKIMKRKLHWKASESPQVIGYKLYWSEGGRVGYTSQCAALDNVTEVLLPDDVAEFSPGGGSIEFGITAVDALGNESDMITFSAEYQFNVPKAPQEVVMEALDDFYATSAAPQEELQSPVEPVQLFEKGVYRLDSQKLEQEDDSSESMEPEEKQLKYYGQYDQD